MTNLPTLTHYENSFAIIHKKTGECVLELNKDDSRLQKINFEKFEAVSISQHLASLNA